MSPTRTRIRRIGGRLLLLLLPLLLAFGATELVLRATQAPPSADPDNEAVDSRWLAAVPSSRLGWIFPPDTTGVFRSSGRNTPLTTNSWGLRGPEVAPGPEVRHILFLGDSYTFGWGVPDSAGFVRVVEADLRREHPSTEVACINGGLPGYSIYQQIRMLDFVGEMTNVDAVVATISLANDPIDEKRIRRFAPDRLAEFSYQLRDPSSLTARLISSSRLLTLIDQRTTHLQFSLINTDRQCRDLADESLRDLAEACRRADLPLVWMIVPRAQEVRPGGFLKRSLNGATERLRRHFLELAGSLEVPVLDLKPVLVEVQSREEAYLPADAHWTAAGHRAVAEALMPFLQEDQSR